MGKMVMVTKGFELTEDMIEVSRMNTEKYLYDDRMEMAVLCTITSADPVKVYRTYVQSFCEMINRNRNCKPAYLTACGFLPIGVEPTILCGKINKDFIMPRLFEEGVDYFQLKPMSPVLASYQPTASMATSHDVWISKIDAAKIVKKPAHNITALDVLEVFGL